MKLSRAQWAAVMILAFAAIAIALLRRPVHADTLAFHLTIPADDQVGGRCDIRTPGSPQLIAVYWSAIKGPAYYYSVAIGDRATRLSVIRDGMPPGPYNVTVMTKKLTPGAHFSCPTSATIATVP